MALAAAVSASGCGADVLATPCSTATDCPPTRTCDQGRCRYVPPAPRDVGHDGGDLGLLDMAVVPLDGGNDAGHDAGIDGGNDAGMDAGNDAGNDGGNDAGHDAALDVGVDADHDAGDDAATDGGCALGPCCDTGTSGACGTGFACRPIAVGATLGSCVACDAASGIVCGSFGSLLVETFFSECDAYAAGADVSSHLVCRCGTGGITCGGAQICDRGVRHLRDCSVGTPPGICVTPSPGSCDPTVHRELTCDDATMFDTECERVSATGGGVMTRLALDCAGTVLGAGECFDDRDCATTGTSCYGARACSMPGHCQSDPSSGSCIDDTDCAPFEACMLGACTTVR